MTTRRSMHTRIDRAMEALAARPRPNLRPEFVAWRAAFDDLTEEEKAPVRADVRAELKRRGLIKH